MIKLKLIIITPKLLQVIHFSLNSCSAWRSVLIMKSESKCKKSIKKSPPIFELIHALYLLNFISAKQK